MCLSISELAALQRDPRARAARSSAERPAYPQGAIAPSWLHTTRSADFPGPDQLTVRWLGTAAFEVRSATAAILIDPYFTRASMWRVLTTPARPDTARIERHLRPVDAVFVGHSHFDHLMDAPAVAGRLGAVLCASEDGLRVARAEGLPEDRLRGLTGGERLEFGDLTVEVVPSLHSKIATQRLVGGPMPDEVRLPLGYLGYKCGPVFGFRILWRGRTLYHSGSAQIVEGNLPVPGTDVLLFCLSGWKADPAIFSRLSRALAPRVVVPMHHDDFFRPLEAGMRAGALTHEAEAVRTIRREMPDASILGLDFFDSLVLEAGVSA